MSIKLSIVIVNYNVKYFLEQALLSVFKAATMPVEVWVVDNCSKDGSVQMVREKFPEVKLIANTENVGFSKANNQAIALSQGQYILLLNPDTLVREDTFEKTLAFMDAHPEAGGLGVRMIDGTGHFLPESKRGFPSPSVAFYKAFGLSKLFPRSKRFNHYHLGYLSPEQTHEVEVLSGAFMLMRKEALDKVGYLDEDFFMYGEDIDLSYRLLKGGYKNYYYADTTIIHYKGESTKKGSLNYVKTFYQAMIIFARKHFSGNQARLYIGMIQLAVYFRALITLVLSFARRFFLPLTEASLFFLGLWGIKEVWEVVRFDDPHYFQPSVFYINFPLYIGIWLGSLYLRGAYDRQAELRHLLEGLGFGTLLLAAVYGFLPLDLRSSRMLIVLGAIWALVSSMAWRALLSHLGWITFQFDRDKPHNVAIIGSIAESLRVQHLLYQAQVSANFIGTIAPQEEPGSTQFIGHLDQLDEIVHWYQLEELIFCGQDLSSERIIYWMNRLGADLRYKIVPEQSMSIIGSNSKNAAGDLYTVELRFQLAQGMQRRHKRLFDFSLALLFLLLSPILAWWQASLGQFLRNIFRVLFGRATWVGYHPADVQQRNLPKLPPGVLSPCHALPALPRDLATLHRLHLLYAKDYRLSEDWRILRRGIRHLGDPQPLSLPLS